MSKLKLNSHGILGSVIWLQQYSLCSLFCCSAAKITGTCMYVRLAPVMWNGWVGVPISRSLCGVAGLDVWSAGTAVCVEDVALKLLPATVGGGKITVKCGRDQRFVLRTHFVLMVAVRCAGEPAVRGGTVCHALAARKFGADIGLVAKHLFVAPVRREATAVVLVLDLSCREVYTKSMVHR